MQLKHSLVEALEWAVGQEDWVLVRRFASLNIGGFTRELTRKGDENKKAELYLTEFSFGPIHGLDLDRVTFDSHLRAARLVEPHLVRCDLVTTQWPGVLLHRPVFSKVDMVGAVAPALFVRDGTLVDVDLRRADLRGCSITASSKG
jgi:uncharacterized protein YjbI with pentapeptide repeats